MRVLFAGWVACVVIGELLRELHGGRDLEQWSKGYAVGLVEGRIAR